MSICVGGFVSTSKYKRLDSSGLCYRCSESHISTNNLHGGHHHRPRHVS